MKTRTYYLPSMGQKISTPHGTAHTAAQHSAYASQMNSLNARRANEYAAELGLQGDKVKANAALEEAKLNNAGAKERAQMGFDSDAALQKGDHGLKRDLFTQEQALKRDQFDRELDHTKERDERRDHLDLVDLIQEQALLDDGTLSDPERASLAKLYDRILPGAGGTITSELGLPLVPNVPGTSTSGPELRQPVSQTTIPRPGGQPGPGLRPPAGLRPPRPAGVILKPANEANETGSPFDDWKEYQDVARRIRLG